MSFSKRENRIYYNPMMKAIGRYNLIEPGEKVAVGMSGGKDSTSLFVMLDTLSKQKRLGFEFEVVPICLDLGFDMDIVPMKELVESKGYELDIVKTDIAKVVFDIREEKNPCSLCAKMRRGYLYSRARELGCQKVALGHHLDDAIETYFMNFLFHGRMESFEPMTYLTQTEVSIIRPMIYLEEKSIIRFCQKKELPVVFNPCPVDKKTKREEMKRLIEGLSVDYPLVKQRFIQGMEQETKENEWKIEKNL
ncbi:tRNA 2-thiocytidine biosynthesis TtcA family protein [Vagococcus carniphilus]|uniref:tRNA 2-thiocytidine biosynthesis TtcA family protein n=1 Tax=Vagococcus carniphilus TaxID=218144 RepID=UPI00288ED0F3|nr:ATP-binding protein [Vagococcus carniphilus]MDT2816176.1 ATP-binding protein [Vagococcus carniphilus]MDT2864304.1 ATP-binding protein [Vagococcus carniphilus]